MPPRAGILQETRRVQVSRHMTDDCCQNYAKLLLKTDAKLDGWELIVPNAMHTRDAKTVIADVHGSVTAFPVLVECCVMKVRLQKRH
jgi:hypothetical protein